MTPINLPKLSRRERQIMDLLYQRGPSTVAEVIDGMDDPPSYSAVRATLRVLEEKGHVSHAEEGPRYVYRPAVEPEQARRSAMNHLVRTFFNGSTEQAVVTLLQMTDSDMSTDQLERLASAVKEAREEGR